MICIFPSTCFRDASSVTGKGTNHTNKICNDSKSNLSLSEGSVPSRTNRACFHLCNLLPASMKSSECWCCVEESVGFIVVFYHGGKLTSVNDLLERQQEIDLQSGQDAFKCLTRSWWEQSDCSSVTVSSSSRTHLFFRYFCVRLPPRPQLPEERLARLKAVSHWDPNLRPNVIIMFLRCKMAVVLTCNWRTFGFTMSRWRKCNVRLRNS